jgi:hypothetical protein
MSHLEDALALQIRATGLPEPAREFWFWAGRKFRFDFAWKPLMLAVECEGGTWTGGRHTRGKGFENDCIKYNEAALLGWRVLRFPASMIHDGRALATIERAMG